ncbi:Fic family protein [Sphingomonas sp.]|jgi:hypothetical protein|uniref:Fic family protein n=1 Tax=Sphingomonas sp. TaxID=28214 RepID=UPI002E2FD72D|nr:Fic family protein [Sphingomonas sp.]HEX4694375.1 Fic family protein [Sphingomonas sp.]
MAQRYRRLALPPLPDDSLSSLPETAARIRGTAHAFGSPLACFGLEQTVQALIEERWPDRITRKPFYRPTPEPALLGCWDAIGTASFVGENLLDFVSVIRGADAEIRTGEICAGGDGDNGVLFEKADFARWADRVKSLYALALPPVTEAIAIYAHTVFAHPFRDGNGRLARALIYGSLRRGGLVPGPCLGLGPTFDLCRRPLALATLALSKRADWPRYVQTLGKVLNLCAANADQAVAARSRKTCEIAEYAA